MPLIINHRSQTVPNIRYDSILDWGSNILAAVNEDDDNPVLRFFSISPAGIDEAAEINSANSDLIFTSFTEASDIAISRGKTYGAIVGDSGFIQVFGFTGNQIASANDADYISDLITAVEFSPDTGYVLAGFGVSGESAKVYRFTPSDIASPMPRVVSPSGLPDMVSDIAFLPGDRDVLMVGNPTSGADYQLWSFNNGFVENRGMGESIVGSEGKRIYVGSRQADNCWPVIITHSDGFVVYKWNGSKFVDTYGSISGVGAVSGACLDNAGSIYITRDQSGGDNDAVHVYPFSTSSGVGTKSDSGGIQYGGIGHDILYNPELDIVVGAANNKIFKLTADGSVPATITDHAIMTGGITTNRLVLV